MKWAKTAFVMATATTTRAFVAFVATRPSLPLIHSAPPPNLRSSKDVKRWETTVAALAADATSLSERGSGIRSVRDDTEMFKVGVADPYHPVDNPDGYLVMLVAENKLLLPESNERLRRVQRAAADRLPDWIFGYGDFGGEDDFKRVIAENVMERVTGGARVDPARLRFQAGAGSVLNLLSLLLGDPGEGVLAVGPTYPAFSADFGMIGGMELGLVATTAESGYVPTDDQLNDAYERMVRAENVPRILLMCQPHNPTGVVYSRDDMDRMIRWALDKRDDLHVVSDEIYLTL